MSTARRSKSEQECVVDTLKISDTEYRRLLGKLDQAAVQARGRTVQRRRDKRFPHAAQFIIRMSHPGGTDGNYIVRARDVSANGLGFLHGNFLHMGTPCTVYLPARDGKWYRIEGVVVRCRLIERRVHDVGVLFDTPVDITAITTLCDDDPTSELDAALDCA